MAPRYRYDWSKGGVRALDSETSENLAQEERTQQRIDKTIAESGKVDLDPGEYGENRSYFSPGDSEGERLRKLARAGRLPEGVGAARARAEGKHITPEQRAAKRRAEREFPKIVAAVREFDKMVEEYDLDRDEFHKAIAPGIAQGKTLNQVRAEYLIGSKKAFQLADDGVIDEAELNRLFDETQSPGEERGEDLAEELTAENKRNVKDLTDEQLLKFMDAADE